MNSRLVAYALHFTSFLLENGVQPNKVILFGSVATGEADEESDVDIFVDTNEPEEKIENIKKMFEKTFGDKWKLKGVNNPLSIRTGSLDKWPEIKRNIQSYGIMLYGRYTELPENVKHYILFILSFGKMQRSKSINIWRKMYGYKQKIGRKVYTTKGIVNQLGGRKVEKSVVIIPIEKSKEFKKFLSKNKISFSLHDVWSDSL